MVNDKTILRKNFMKIRSTIDNKSISERIQHNILKSKLWQEAKIIGLYMPIRGEIDTSLLRAMGLMYHKQICLPRCLNNNEMEFVICAHEKHMIKSKLGILEPNENCLALSEDFAPDLVIIPALAYDKKGYRLGYGGGYYDRILAKKSFAKTKKLGIISATCMIEELPINEYDIKVDAIATEEQIIWI